MALYLLEYERPAGNPNKARASARYYLGYSKDSNLFCRIKQHREGTWIELDIPDKDPPALPRWFHEQGITFKVVRIIWGGSRSLERKLKKAGHYERIITRRFKCEQQDEGETLPITYVPSVAELPF